MMKIIQVRAIILFLSFIIFVKADNRIRRWQDLPISCFDCSKDGCKRENLPKTVCELMDATCRTVFSSNGEVIRRGCSDKLNKESEIEEICHNKDNGLCYDCYSNNCNIAKKQTDYIDCISCDSKLDSYCVQSPLDVFQVRKCYKNCMIALYPKNTSDKKSKSYELVRGCLDDKEIEDQNKCDGKECTKCNNGNRCNGINFPDDRLKCEFCTFLGRCRDTRSDYCISYKKNDKCVYLFNLDNTLKSLHCESDLTEDTIKAYTNLKLIHSCSTKNCNNVKALQKCYNCSSLMCSLRPELLAQTKYCYSGDKSCYSMVKDKETYRGCTSDLPNGKCDPQNKFCDTCKNEQLCNKDEYPKFRLQCHTCNSYFNSGCEKGENSLAYCNLYDPEDACLTIRNKKTTIRGCKSQLGACSSYPGSACTECYEKGCNNKLPKVSNKSSSTNLPTIKTLLLSSIVLMIAGLLNM